MLKLDWCSHQAAEYACLNWHYSKSVPVGKLVKIGVWEHEQFIGCVLYSSGANRNIGSPYKLTQDKVCELTRVALRKHSSAVSRILAISFKMLKQVAPNLRLIVSYADADQNHKGGIYKAGNWIYTGLQNANKSNGFIVRGKLMHQKTVYGRGLVGNLSAVKRHLDPNATQWVTKGKHKYLMPLDDEMKKVALALQKPYPK